MYLDSEKTVSANLLTDFLFLFTTAVIGTIFLLPLRELIIKAEGSLLYTRAGVWAAALLLQVLFLQRLPAHGIFRNSFSVLKGSSPILAALVLGGQLLLAGAAIFAIGELFLQVESVWFFILFLVVIAPLLGWVLYRLWLVRPIETSVDNFQGFINPHYHPLGEFESDTVRIGVGRRSRPPSTISLFFPVMILSITIYFFAFFFDSYLKDPIIGPFWYIGGMLGFRWLIISVSDFRPWFKFFLALFTTVFTAVIFL